MGMTAYGMDQRFQEWFDYPWTKYSARKARAAYRKLGRKRARREAKQIIKENLPR